MATVACASIGHIKAGRLRALAVTTETRSPILPDIPTVSEFVPGYEASGWSGFGSPKSTPIEVIDKLNRETKIKAQLADLGSPALAGSPADFGKLIAQRNREVGEGDPRHNIKAE
jgi:tripartite-type tricarboxylate transporter receptor subunit TctC